MRIVVAQHYSRWRKIFLVFVATIGALLVNAVPASAHNVLVSSNPVAGSVMSKAPKTVTLVFDQDVQTLYAEMAITVGSQAPVEFAPTVHGRDVTADLSLENVTIPPVSTGLVAWKLGYRIVSADGHPVSGLVDFSVGTGVAATPTSPVAAGPPSDSGGPIWWVIVVVAVFVMVAVAWTFLIRSRSAPRRGSAPESRSSGRGD